jgi:multicomponent Na+:H+ antiporter subunit G
VTGVARVIDVLVAVSWLVGAAFALLAAVGVLRMPDVFTRMQASTKASTLGLGCLLVGAALHLGDFAGVVRAASIGAFVLLTSPVAAHVIARAAYIAEVPLWEGTVVDERRRDARRDAGEFDGAPSTGSSSRGAHEGTRPHDVGQQES